MTCSVFSPFEEMDPPVSLQHSESKRSKSQKCRVARDILRRTNSRSVSHSRVVFFKTTQTSCLCSGGDDKFFFSWHIKSSPHTQWKTKRSLCIKMHIGWADWPSSVQPTLHGWGSTPYVSNIWAFWRKLSSDVSGVWPLWRKSKVGVHSFQVNTKIIRMAPMRSQRHADGGEQMTSDRLWTHSEDRKPGSDGDISYRCCAEVVQPHFSTLVPIPAFLLWRDTDAVQSFWAFESFQSSDYASLDKFSKSKIWIENHYIFYE